MKRFFAMFLALLMMLCACAQEAAPTEPKETTQPVSQKPTEPDGPVSAYQPLYEPYSTVEILTCGAVKKYAPDVEDVYALAVMGDAIVLFSGTEETVLTCLGAEGERYSAVLTGCFLYPDGETTHVTVDGICYYDGEANAVVHLDRTLQETARIRLPFQISGPLIMTADGEKIFYFGEDSLRWLELRTGISRMLTEMTFDHQEVVGLHFGGSLVECYVGSEGSYETLFISAENGQTLFSSNSSPELHTSGNRFFAQWQEGHITQWIFGNRGDQESCLLLDDQWQVSPMFGLGGVLTRKTDSTGSSLAYYDLDTGIRSAAVRMAGVGNPWSMAEDMKHGLVWFLAPGIAAGSPVMLYSWELGRSETGDTTSCATPYYTALEPDTNGLKQLVAQAKSLGDQYGVRIYIWEDALDHVPSDYTFTSEYLVQAYQYYLPVLQKALSRFPDGFFKKLGRQSNNKLLTISLIRDAHGDNELGSLEEAAGVHFWEKGNSYLALTMGDHFEQTFYHELFHCMDSYILSETQAYDFWDQLNPDGFRYDFSYVTNLHREDYQYLEEGSRAFIDMYSMSFPKEDRARIIEYAVMDDCAQYFQSDIMQAKLKTVCKGIREAFGLEKDTRTFLWEQYLKEPLAYKK